MKILNSRTRMPENLAISAMRSFTTNNPSKVAINKKNQYLACWVGNKEMWLEIFGAGNRWCITVGTTRKAIESVVSVHRNFFYSNDPMTELRTHLNVVIPDFGFKF